MKGAQMPIRIEDDATYHGGEGVSKSGLWKLWSKTPYHFRFGAKKETTALDVGKAAHLAILQPELFEGAVIRGPADRRGNKWKEAQDFADFSKAILLTQDDYDQCLAIRELAATCAELDVLRGGEHIIETSAYHVDEETGVLVKTKPDVYSVQHKIIADIKNMADASFDAFRRDIPKFGYHMQEASYTDIWSNGSGYDVDGFLFVVMEKSDPPMLAVYELDAPAVAEGHAIYREALRRYAECERTNTWPGYPSGVQRIGLRDRWAYKMTTPPEGME